MEKHFITSVTAKALFTLLLIVSGSLFVVTMVDFLRGFIMHMHDTDGYKAVLRIIATPFTHPVIALPVASLALRYIIVFILNYLLPACFFIGIHFIKMDYVKSHSGEVHSY